MTKTKSAFAALPKNVQEIINRTAPAQAKKHGITLKQAREALAKGVRKYEGRGYSNGTGH